MPQNNFDALRLFFAVLVIVAHAYALHPRTSIPDPVARLGVASLSFGEVAVFGFFIISGFLISGSYVKSRGIGDYALKRILRIYPGYLVAFVVSIVAVSLAFVGNLNTGIPLTTLLRRALTLDAPGRLQPPAGPPVNGSMGTIMSEFACYIGLAIFGMIGGLRRRWPIVGLVILGYVVETTLALRPAVTEHWPVRAASAPAFALYFMIGTCAYVFRERLPFRSWHLVLALVVLLASSAHPIALLICFPPTFGILVLGIGLRSWRYVRHASRYGDFSYGIYLYAFPIQVCLNIARAGTSPTLTPLVDSVWVLLITLPFAVVSWFVVERPAMKWKARHLASASPHAAEVVHAS